MDARFKRLASRMTRYWRGARTQVDASADLNFSSNVFCHWESGRRFPSASTAFRLSFAKHPEARNLLHAGVGADWTHRCALETRDEVALFLGDLAALHDLPVKRIADACGVTRTSVTRWLSGRTEPNLPRLLAFLEATKSLDWFIGLVAPDIAPPPGIPQSATPPSASCIRLLLTTMMSTYESRQHSDLWVARRTGESVDVVRQNLRDLVERGLLRWNGERYEPMTDKLNELRFIADKDEINLVKQRQAFGELLQHSHPYFEGCLSLVIKPEQAPKARTILVTALHKIAELTHTRRGSGELVSLGIFLIPHDKETKLHAWPK